MSLTDGSKFIMRQNFWLKLTMLMLGSVAAAAAPVKALFWLSFLNISYLLISPAIYREVWVGLKRFLPFFAGYTLLAVLMKMDYPAMLIFLLRITNLILLMVFFASGMRIDCLMEDLQCLKNRQYISTAVFFLVAITVFMRQFKTYYLSQIESDKSKNYNSDSQPVSKKVLRLLPLLSDAIAVNWQTKDKVDALSREILAKEYFAPQILSRQNMLGLAYIAALVVVLAL